VSYRPDLKARGSETVGHLPGVQYINLDLFSSSPDCGDFIVRDGISEVIIGDLSNVALANEQTGFGLQSINVVSQL
jgi:hypothetical protein